jgi:hypothetical protein
MTQRKNPRRVPWIDLSSAATLSAAALKLIKIKPMSWDDLPAALKERFQKGGMRGGLSRGDAEAKALFGKVPSSVRIQGEAAVQEYLEGKDFSHVVSHDNGGSFKATNMEFEPASANRARGGKNMARKERANLETQNLRQAGAMKFAEAHKAGLKMSAVAAFSEAFWVIPEQAFLRWRGVITTKEAVQNSATQIGSKAAFAYVSGAVVQYATLTYGAGFLAAPVVVALTPFAVAAAPFVGFGFLAATAFSGGLRWWNAWHSASDIPQLPDITARSQYMSDGPLVLVWNDGQMKSRLDFAA